MFKEIDLSVFPPERQQKLESIPRYHVFNTLFYRSSVWTHAHRVLWLLEEFIPFAQKHITFDAEKARIGALIHDDAEMVTGDVQAIAKLRMTPEERVQYEKEEAQAIDDLVKRYPEKVHGYSYRALLEHASKKDCIEAQLVSYVDKLDAYCESLHEVYAGNMSLLRSVTFYANALPLFPIKYPDLKPLLARKDSPLTHFSDLFSPFDVRAEAFSQLGKPHTEESLKINTDYPFYKVWKEIIIKKGKIDWLINQREFLPKKK